MAPIRDWTGAITISPLPYCEIAAGGFAVEKEPRLLHLKIKMIARCVACNHIRF